VERSFVFFSLVPFFEKRNQKTFQKYAPHFWIARLERQLLCERVVVKGEVFGFILRDLFCISKLLTVQSTNAEATEVSEGCKRGVVVNGKGKLHLRISCW
jgi:hypothetical protein